MKKYFNLMLQKSNNKKVFLIVIAIVLLFTSTFSLILYVNSHSTISVNAQTSPQSTEYKMCNEKVKISTLYDIPSKTEVQNIVSITKSQRIYRDYSKFLESKGYTEDVNAAFCGYFKKPPALKQKTINSNETSKSLYSTNSLYAANIGTKKSYILSVPFVDKNNKNRIAGIVFIYSHKFIASYIIEEEKDINNPKKVQVNIFLENRNKEIVNASQIIGADSIVDGKCASKCAATCAVDRGCWMIPFPVNMPCFATCWAICYDMCVLMP